MSPFGPGTSTRPPGGTLVAISPATDPVEVDPIADIPMPMIEPRASLAGVDVGSAGRGWWGGGLGARGGGCVRGEGIWGGGGAGFGGPGGLPPDRGGFGGGGGVDSPPRAWAPPPGAPPAGGVFFSPPINR